MNRKEILKHSFTKEIFEYAFDLGLNQNLNNFDLNVEWDKVINQVYFFSYKEKIKEIKVDGWLWTDNHPLFYDKILTRYFDWSLVNRIENDKKEIFTIGDNFLFKNKKYTIERFNLSSHKLKKNLEHIDNSIDVWAIEKFGEPICSLNELIPYKEPLLISFDQVEIYEGQWVKIYNTNTNCFADIVATEGLKNLKEDELIFSCVEAMENYVKMNEARYSVKDFIDFFTSNYILNKYNVNELANKLKEHFKIS